MFVVTSVAASTFGTLPSATQLRLNTPQLAVAAWRPCRFLTKGGTLTGRALQKRLPLKAGTKSARPGRILVKSVAVSASGSSHDAVSGSSSEFAKVSAFLTSYFPVWVAIACVAAVVHPPSFLWFKKDFVTAGLALTMLAMGTTLSLEDFQNVVKAPGRVMLGTVLQYTIMPMMGFAVSRLAGLPTPFAIGICLVASCPGGTASNVVTFLANADVALSVMMTTVSTFAAVVMTPLLTKTLVGAMVPVDARALFVSTLQVVLVPVVLGATLNQNFPKVVTRTAPFAPLVAVIAVVLIVASVMAQNAAAVTLAGPKLVGAIIALHTGGFAFGYWASRIAGLPEKAARTNSIEVMSLLHCVTICRHLLLAGNVLPVDNLSACC
ncbi:hypothetical protein ABBQ32_012705 [Trebouxia sp. C0010 RCD-2024]